MNLRRLLPVLVAVIVLGTGIPGCGGSKEEGPVRVESDPFKDRLKKPDAKAQRKQAKFR
jgi:hypothetical protein